MTSFQAFALIAAQFAALADLVTAQQGETDQSRLTRCLEGRRYWIEVDGEKVGVLEYRAGHHSPNEGFSLTYDRADVLGLSERLTYSFSDTARLSPSSYSIGDSKPLFRVGHEWIERGKHRIVKTPKWLIVRPELVGVTKSVEWNAHFAVLDLWEARVIGPGKAQMYTEVIPDVLRAAGATQAYTVEIPTPEEGAKERVRERWLVGMGKDSAVVAMQREVINADTGQHLERFLQISEQEWSTLDGKYNEFLVACKLSQLARIQNILRAFDCDENSQNDYWTGDVSGLYRLIPAGSQNCLRLIARDVAEADSLPVKSEVPGARLEGLLCKTPRAWRGYLFLSVRDWQSDNGEIVRSNDKEVRGSRFAICAYPSDFAMSGGRTLLVTLDGRCYAKATGGTVIESIPLDLEKGGWTRVLGVK